MHAFGNKIYFGDGNSYNVGPAPNSGHAVLWSYDLATNDFVKEFTVDEEQIHLIREFEINSTCPGTTRVRVGIWKTFIVLSPANGKNTARFPMGFIFMIFLNGERDFL